MRVPLTCHEGTINVPLMYHWRTMNVPFTYQFIFLERGFRLYCSATNISAMKRVAIGATDANITAVYMFFFSGAHIIWVLPHMTKLVFVFPIVFTGQESKHVFWKRLDPELGTFLSKIRITEIHPKISEVQEMVCCKRSGAETWSIWTGLALRAFLKGWWR